MRHASFDLSGRSGRGYTFLRYEHIPVFKTAVACVYCLLAPPESPQGRPRVLHLGQTEDFNKHARKALAFALLRHPALATEACIGVLTLHDGSSRRAIEQDLLEGLCEQTPQGGTAWAW